MHMLTNIVAHNARAVRASSAVVDRVLDTDLGRPTPCADWNVLELLMHMTAQHRGFAVDRRRGGDAQVGRASAHLQRGAAVLRGAGGRDVEVGQHLGAGDHASAKRRGDRLQIT